MQLNKFHIIFIALILAAGTANAAVATLVTEVVSTESTENSSTPSIAVDDTNIHIAWHDSTNYAGAGTDRDIFYKTKTKIGGAWSDMQTEVVSTESTGNAQYPTIAVDDTNIHITWADNTDYAGAGTDTDIFYKTKAKTGNWQTNTEVISTESTGVSSMSQIAVDDTNIHIIWYDQTNYQDAGTDYDIFYKTKAKINGPMNDQNWAMQTQVISTESTSPSYYPSIAIDDVNIYVVWGDYTDYAGAGGSYKNIFYKTKAKINGPMNNQNWAMQTEVVSSESTGRTESATIAVDDTNIYIAWEDQTNYGSSGTDYDIFYKTKAKINGPMNDQNWAMQTQVISTESTGNSQNPSIAVDDTNIHITWADNTDYAGAGTDTDIFYKTKAKINGPMNDQNWAMQTQVISTESTVTSNSPDLNVYGGKVFITWVDSSDFNGTDQDITFYSFTPSELPSVSITAPSGGIVVSNNTTVSATVSAIEKIQAVNFYYTPNIMTGKTGTLICSDSSSPYSCNWNPTAIADTQYKIKAIALTTDGDKVQNIMNRAFTTDNNGHSDIYNFLTCSNCWAFEEKDASLPLDTLYLDTNTAIDASTNIETSDDTREFFSGTLDYYEIQQFIFNVIDHTPHTLNMHFQYEGAATQEDSAGLKLYVWNFDTPGYELLASNDNWIETTISETITSNFNNYINTDGNVFIIAESSTVVDSCPFLYVWNGTEFVLEDDLINQGMLGVWNALGRRRAYPHDFEVIDKPLVAENGKYKLEIKQTADELSYIDKVNLYYFDLPKWLDVMPGASAMTTVWEKEETQKIGKELNTLHTVSKKPKTPISCTDKKGNCLEKIAKKDYQIESETVHGFKPKEAVLGTQFEWDIITLDLGDLSKAKEIKLITSGTTEWPTQPDWDTNPNATGTHPAFIETIGLNGEWEFATHTPIPNGYGETYAFPITNIFKTNDYRIRLNIFAKTHLDYIATDTTPDLSLELKELPLTKAELYNFGKGTSFEGNITKYGNILPLLKKTDNKYAILPQGDGIKLEFEEEQNNFFGINTTKLKEMLGLEKRFILNTDGYFKQEKYGLERTVNPIPFYNQTNYPYPPEEQYPQDKEHQDYLTEWNTRHTTPTEPDHNTIYTDFVQLTVSYNNAPDGNVVTIEGNDATQGQPIYSYNNDGNLTIDFNVSDPNNSSLTADINYSATNTQGTGTAIANNLPLSADICDDANFLDSTKCSWDWDIQETSDGNYFINILVKDSYGLSDYNSSQTLYIDATGPSINIHTIDENPDNATLPPFTFSTDGNLTIDFNVLDEQGGNLTVDLNYSTSDVQGTGTPIANNLSLSATICDNTDFSNTTQCSWDWDISTAQADEYYIIALVSDGTLTGYNPSNNTLQIYLPTTELGGPGQAYCGDRECNGRETASTCALDCPPVCGDGACTGTESFFTCPQDCFGCGDGTCSSTESYSTCPADCESVCGDNVCADTENCLTCPNDCGTCPEEKTILKQVIKEATKEEIEEVLESIGEEQTIKSAEEAAEKVKLERTVKVQEAQITTTKTGYKTTISIKATNKTGKKLKNIKILEVIPKDVAETASLIKSDLKFRVIQEDPIIEFTIGEIGIGQTAEVTYFVEKKIEQATLAEWVAPIPTAAKEITPKPTTCSIDSDCDDQEPCTNEFCLNGQCSFIPVANGTTCGFGMECKSAECTEIQRIQTAEEQDHNTILIAAAVLLIIAAAAWHYKKM